jgi:superfamily II DNA or RNA helicase
LSNQISLPREARSWVKELQTVRNKWAHLSSESLPASDTYRDVDTLGRLLAVLGAAPSTLEAVESFKAATLAAMAGSPRRPTREMDGPAVPRKVPSAETGPETPTALPAAPPGTKLKLGDLVALQSNPNTILPIIEVIPGGAECRYRVLENNARATYYESQLKPANLATDQRRVHTARELQPHLTSLQILSPSTANLFSLRLGRIQFVPYQYRPVLKLVRADRARLLIADEVGVGKTIEAGLIIKELGARTDIASVLIICPKALVAERKWHAEMKRFDEHFTALDGPLLRHCLRETHLDGEWPAQYAHAILPFSLFDSDLLFGRASRAKSRTEGLLALDPPPSFDLVIVDEAHHIRNPETFLHQGVRYFCDNAQAVVLLTATPVQLGSEDLFTLLHVLRPDLVIDRASFQQMAEPNPYINEAVQHCRAARPGWQKESLARLDDAAQTEWGRLFLRESPTFQDIYDRLRDDSLREEDRIGLIRAIEELYTFSPLINRTRRRDIGDFTTRKPQTLTVDFTATQRRLHDGLLDVIARILVYCHGNRNTKFMMTTVRRQAASCLYGLAPLLSDILHGKLDQLELMEATDTDHEADLGFVDQVRTDIEALLEQARNLDHDDPKATAFIRVLLDNNARANNKALVFSTFRHTLAYLHAHVRSAGLRVGLIHGDVPDDERAALRRRFALPKDDAEALDVLLSSEVGCEGLDFQFCDLLINYDLPWNPMRIEQRIGRIDRYGQQSETVAIVNLITPGTVDAEIYERCLWRIGVFQHAVGGSEEILGAIAQELHDIAESFSLTADERTQRLQQLSDNSIRQIREQQELESRQSELFGLNIPGRSWRDEIQAAESSWLSPAAIQGCVTAYLTAKLGADSEHLLGAKSLKTLRLSQEARALLLADYRLLSPSLEPTARGWEKWLNGAQPTLPVTFDQETATENPHATHLSVVHPLVRQAARFLEITEPKYVTLAVERNDIPAGVHHFALYRWTKEGAKPDQALIPVADHPSLEPCLLEMLQYDCRPTDALPPDAATCDALDVAHHRQWAAARANHIEENRQIVERRIQSLRFSHRARCTAIGDQLARATDDKIRLMKESELARANADFNRRLDELEQAANNADIRATAVVFGTISVTGTKP